MTIEIRPTKPDEMRAASDVTGIALMFPPATDEEWAKRELSWLESDSITAWDGDRCVGHAGAHKFDSTVPGGARLPMSGVTRVGVLPTYTRRGLLSGMIERLLRDARADGRILAGLRASEAVIYRRFGFGVAGEATSVRVRSRTARPLRAVESGSGATRLLEASEVLDVVAAVYDRCARHRTGSISRPRWYLERDLEDVLAGKKSAFVAVHLDPAGSPDGFVHYTMAWDESDNDDVARGELHSLFGADAAVERALWAYLVGIDLVDEWRAEQRPLDEAVRFTFADMRAYRVRQVWDEQWLRLLDVDVALQARAYRRTDRAVVIGVQDPWFAENTGAWRIEQSDATRTDAPADLTVGIDVLSAAYLGGTSWRELVDAGQVEVLRPEAVADADTLFAEHPAPFCGSFY